jgi:hypothetical protein
VPMLSAKVVTFALMTAVKSLNDRYFPLVHIPRPVPGAHVAPGVSLAQSLVQLEMLAARGFTSLTSQIAESMLEGFAIALTVVLATELYRYGNGSLRSAVERVKQVPSLAWILFRFIILYMLILLGVGCVLAILLGIFLLVFHGRLGAPPSPASMPSSLFYWFDLFGFGVGAIVAYLLVPHFLELVAKIQRQPPPYYWVRQETAKPVLYFAWSAVAMVLVAGTIVAHVNLAIAGGPLQTNTPLHLVQRLGGELITELPTIWFVVVATVFAARAGEPVIESEHATVTS